MHKERLLALAEYLEGVDPQRFNLASWASPKDEDQMLEEFVIRDEHDRVIGYQRATCGFTACAVGHAVAVPMLREAGLGLRFQRMWNRDYSGTFATPTLTVEAEGETQVFEDWEAVEELFDIDITDAHYLFSPDSYDYSQLRNPKVVAERIREIVAEYAFA